MYESYTTIVGNVASNLTRRTVGQSGDEVLRFTVASTTRLFDKGTGTWRDGNTLFVRVSCWNRAVHRVIASLTKGDPVIVHGDLHTNEYTDGDGNPRTSLELRARAVGPDVTRCIAEIDRRARLKAETPEVAEGSSMDSVGVSTPLSEDQVAAVEEADADDLLFADDRDDAQDRDTGLVAVA